MNKKGLPKLNKHKVVLLCITFNQSKYIDDTMNGFAMQKTDFPFLCCVFDDASTDGEQNILERWIQDHCDRENIEIYDHQLAMIYLAHDKTNHNCLYVIHLQKVNTWGKQVKRELLDYWGQLGEYQAHCEGDDYWIDPLKLQKQIDFMDANPNCSLCFHNAKVIYDTDKRYIGEHRIYSSSRYANQLDVFCDGGFIPTLSIVYRTKMFENFSSYPTTCPVGDLMIQTYATLVGDVYYINESMGVYRRAPGSATHLFASTIDSYVNHHQKFIKWYKDVDIYTKGDIHAIIETAISFSEARIIIATKKYTKLWNPRYRGFLKKQPRNTQFGLFLSMIGLSCIYKAGHEILTIIRRLKVKATFK